MFWKYLITFISGAVSVFVIAFVYDYLEDYFRQRKYIIVNNTVEDSELREKNKKNIFGMD